MSEQNINHGTKPMKLAEEWLKVWHAKEEGEKIKLVPAIELFRLIQADALASVATQPSSGDVDPYDIAIMREADSTVILKIISDDTDLSDLYKLISKNYGCVPAELESVKECVLSIHQRLNVASISGEIEPVNGDEKLAHDVACEILRREEIPSKQLALLIRKATKLISNALASRSTHNAELVEALKFYAEMKNFASWTGECIDHGDVAKAALAKLPAAPEKD